MDHSTQQAMARRVAHRHLAKSEVSVWEFVDQTKWDRVRKALAETKDFNAIKLLEAATQRIEKALTLPRDEHIALMRMQMLMQRPEVGADNLKKQIQNIARILGLKP